MSPDRLIYMANQIGKFFESQRPDKAVPGIAEHIRKFWDPRMRTAILAHLRRLRT
jgi:formate dehydrogenase subunit delta